jgi:hypothetical protein
MPSQLHEALLLLFRNRPALAPELLRDALRIPLPAYTDVRIDSAELTDIQPAEYRADLVVLLLEGVPVLGIVVEAQLSPDERKRFVWPVYAVNLRARLEAPVCVLVVTADEATARWAARPIDLGGGNRFTPLASLGLDEDRSRLYFDLVLASLSEAARKELRTMDPAKYEYQSDFAKHYVAQGKAEGELRGRAGLITRQLTLRFGPLPPEALSRIATASIEELDAIGERLLTARTLEEAWA